MIDYQPSHGMRHCMCSSVTDGFTYSSTAETYVHAACGKPRPAVQTNLHQLPAPVAVPAEDLYADTEGRPVTGTIHLTSTEHPPPQVLPGNPTTSKDWEQVDEGTWQPILDAQARGEFPETPATHPWVGPQAPAEKVYQQASPSEPYSGEYPTEPTALLTEQPKRKRGRPPKDTRGLTLERRDAPDRWCVIREATGEIITSGLTSKAKATAAMDDLIREASDGVLGVPTQAGPAEPPTAGVPATPLGQPDPTQPATAGGPAADHLPAGAGQPAGPAVGGVRADLGGGQPEDEAAERAEGLDQSGAEPTVPGPGSHGYQPEPKGAMEVLPAGQGEGGPGGTPKDVPGGVGPVHIGGNELDPREAVIHGSTTDYAQFILREPLPADQPVIHGPQGDCPECFRLWDWCPASFDPLPAPSNPPAAEASPTTSGPGGLPASAVQPGPMTPEQTNPCAAPNEHASAQASRPAAPAKAYLGPNHPAPGLLATLSEPSTPGGNPVDNLTLPGAVIDSSRPSLAAFMSAAKAVPMSGNTQWAAAYCNELREVVRWHGDNAPRNLQRHLGPSEIGHPCDRNVVGKLVGFPKTNHVVDPWPSIVGTAIHTWMDGTFQAENQRIGFERWLPERKVTPHPEHPGTSDLYDAQTFTVVDHKNLGESSMAKLRSPNGPPIHYQFQLKLYARGYRNQGLRVDRIVIIGWPRTGSSLDGAYAWEHVLTPTDDEQLEQLFTRMQWRNQWAGAINQGLAQLGDVPAVPDPDDCYMCPFYRPQSAKDGGPGCPGHAGL